MPPGVSGEVRIRSDRTVDRYLGDPAATARAFRDGWFHPGDVGRLDADGLLIIEGRTDEVMNLAGHKLLPGWIERPALACAGVADAGAIALADADGLRRCCLALVTDESFTEAALVEALAEPIRRLSKIHWVAVDAIPRNAMGKIDRRQLGEKVAVALAQRVGGGG